MDLLKQKIRQIVSGVADFLLPPVCISCKTGVTRHNSLCPKCWHQVNFIVPPICNILGIPMSYQTGDVDISAAAIVSPPPYNRARSVAVFEGPLKQMIHALKYGDRHEGVKLFSRWMCLAGKDLLEDAEVLIPVPLSRRRLWYRRFNQAALLAHAIGRQQGIMVDCMSLVRRKHTDTQVGLTRKQREKNVSGAFRVPETRKDLIAGRKIILIDDVMTTGATIKACTKILRRAKAERIDVLTLARVIDPLALDL